MTAVVVVVAMIAVSVFETGVVPAAVAAVVMTAGYPDEH